MTGSAEAPAPGCEGGGGGCTSAGSGSSSSGRAIGIGAPIGRRSGIEGTGGFSSSSESYAEDVSHIRQTTDMSKMALPLEAKGVIPIM